MKRFSIIPAILFALFVQAQNEPTHFVRHTVEWDETIYSIPVHYSISTKDFLNLNHFTSDIKLSEGQTVLIRPMTPGEVLALNKTAIQEKTTAATPEPKAAEPQPVKSEELTSKKEIAQQEVVVEKKEPAVIEKPAPVVVEVKAPLEEVKPIVEKREKAIQAFNEAPVAKADKKSFANEDLGPNGITYTISNSGYHQVEKKQTFYHIALIYGLTVDELKRINNMASTDIAIGQKLKVSM